MIEVIPTRSSASGRSKRLLASSLFAVSFLGIVLGFFGFAAAEPGRSIASNIYLAIQLLSMESGNVPEPSTILEWARWMAPVGVMAGLVVSLSEQIWKLTKRLRISFYRNHTIVIGLGEKGRAYAASLRALPRAARILAVDMAAPAPEAWELVQREPGNPRSSITLLRGDARDPGVLRAMSIHKAQSIFVLAGDDETNLAIANLALAIQQENGSSRAAKDRKLSVHIADGALRRALQRQQQAQQTPSDRALAIQTKYESHFVQLARRILLSWPLEHVGGRDGACDLAVEMHLLMDGVDELQCALLLEAARTGHYLGGRKVHVHVIASNREQARAAIDKAAPALLHCVASLNVIEAPAEARTSRLAMLLREMDPGHLATVMPARRPLAEMHAEALRLRDLVRGRNFRVLLPKGDEAVKRLAMLHDDRGLGGSCGLYEERAILDECVMDSLDNKSDRVAEEIHSRWYRNQQQLAARLDAEGKTEDAAKIRAKAPFRPWQELTEAQRVQSHAQACHAYTKLKAVGLKANDLPAAFSPSQIEVLARMEHERWMACQRLEGWIPGDKRMDDMRIHDNLVPYDALPESVRQSDRDAVNNVLTLRDQLREELEIIERMHSRTPNGPKRNS